MDERQLKQVVIVEPGVVRYEYEDGTSRQVTQATDPASLQSIFDMLEQKKKKMNQNNMPINQEDEMDEESILKGMRR